MCGSDYTYNKSLDYNPFTDQKVMALSRHERVYSRCVSHCWLPECDINNKCFVGESCPTRGPARSFRSHSPKTFRQLFDLRECNNRNNVTWIKIAWTKNTRKFLPKKNLVLGKVFFRYERTSGKRRLLRGVELKNVHFFLWSTRPRDEITILLM